MASFIRPSLKHLSRINSLYRNVLQVRSLNSVCVVAAKAPLQVELKASKRYSWCSCGLSKKQPFCDGSHKGTGLSPVRFRQEEDISEAFLCCCKQTSTPPFCDGTHATENIQNAEIGKPVQ